MSAKLCTCQPLHAAGAAKRGAHRVRRDTSPCCGGMLASMVACPGPGMAQISRGDEEEGEVEMEYGRMNIYVYIYVQTEAWSEI